LKINADDATVVPINLHGPAFELAKIWRWHRLQHWHCYPIVAIQARRPTERLHVFGIGVIAKLGFQRRSANFLSRDGVGDGICGKGWNR